MLKLLIIPALLILAVNPEQPDCPCKKFPFVKGAATGHMTTTVYNQKPIARIMGKVTDNSGGLVLHASVYVWRRPKDISDDDFASGKIVFDEYRNRLTACQTGADGRFCFKGIPAGKYMVCAYGLDFNSTCVLVTLKTKSRKRGFNIVLDPGT
jgi:hypothetical protein